MSHPTPYEYDGNKTYLLDRVDDPLPMVAVVANAALYLGEVLEHICFELQRQGAPRPSPTWFPDNPHGQDH